ncbi:MAG: metal-dependent hydrolase [Candidatus Aenigmatarchaeota archaeon]
MKKPTHITSAILLFLFLWLFYPIDPFLLTFTLFGALLPDIDIKIRDLHRKLLHNLWIGAFLGYAFFILNPQYCLAFLIGFASHLIIDSMTPVGIAPFWPFGIRVTGNVVTGGTKEMLFSVFLMILILIIFVVKFL